jgi:hypothetical protein
MVRYVSHIPISQDRHEYPATPGHVHPQLEYGTRGWAVNPGFGLVTVT